MPRRSRQRDVAPLKQLVELDGDYVKPGRSLGVSASTIGGWIRAGTMPMLAHLAVTHILSRRLGVEAEKEQRKNPALLIVMKLDRDTLKDLSPILKRFGVKALTITDELIECFGGEES